MKKWIISLGVVLLLILLIIFVLPLGIGYLIQERYPRILNTISQTGRVQLSLESYRRGWFASEATVKVRVNKSGLAQFSEWLGDNDESMLEFTIAQSIDHGPILHAHPLVGNKPWYIGQALIDTQIYPVVGKIDSATLVQSNGSLLSFITAPELVYQNTKRNLKVTIRKLNGKLQLSSDLRKISGIINLPQTDVQTPHFVQNIAGLSVNFKLMRAEEGFFLGQKQTHINTITWSDPNHQAQIIMRELQMHSASNEKDNKVDYKLTVFLKTLNFEQVDYGPENIDIAIHGMDVPAFLALTNELKKAQAMPSSSALQLMRYNKLLLALLGKGVKLDLKAINIVSPYGALSLSGPIKFAPQATESPTLLDILANSDISLNLRLSSNFLNELLLFTTQNLLLSHGILPALLGAQLLAGPTAANPEQQVQSQIERFVQEKWLIHQGNDYLLKFVYKNKQAFINDSAINENHSNK